MVLAFKAINGTAPIHLRPNTGQTTCPSESTSLIYISWPTGTPMADSKQSPLSRVATLLCFGTSVVGQTPNQCQDSSTCRKTSGIIFAFSSGGGTHPTVFQWHNSIKRHIPSCVGWIAAAKQQHTTPRIGVPVQGSVYAADQQRCSQVFFFCKSKSSLKSLVTSLSQVSSL